MARAAKYIKRGAYVGIVLDTASTAVEINAACSTGREEECTKATYVEGGKLIGGLGGATAGGLAATIATNAICVTALGLTTGPGALACGVITAGILGWVGEEISGKACEMTGETLNEVWQ